MAFLEQLCSAMTLGPQWSNICLLTLAINDIGHVHL